MLYSLKIKGPLDIFHGTCSKFGTETINSIGGPRMSILHIIPCVSTVRLFFRIPSSHFLSPPTVLTTYPLLLLSFLSVQFDVPLPHLARAQATVGPSSSLPPSFPPFRPSARNDRSPSRLPLSGRLAPPPTDPLRLGKGRQDRPTNLVVR